MIMDAPGAAIAFAAPFGSLAIAMRSKTSLIGMAAIAPFVVIIMNALHEAGHILAAKALGYSVNFSINSASLENATGVSDIERVLVDAGGPAVTVILALIGLRLSRNPGNLGPLMVFTAFMMRVIASIVSLSTPNDEARIGETLGIGFWTVPAIVVAILLGILVITARRRRLGFAWFAAAWVGVTIGFTVVVMGEPYLPRLTW